MSGRARWLLSSALSMRARTRSVAVSLPCGVAGAAIRSSRPGKASVFRGVRGFEEQCAAGKDLAAGGALDDYTLADDQRDAFGDAHRHCCGGVSAVDAGLVGLLQRGGAGTVEGGWPAGSPSMASARC